MFRVSPGRSRKPRGDLSFLFICTSFIFDLAVFESEYVSVCPFAVRLTDRLARMMSVGAFLTINLVVGIVVIRAAELL